MTESSERGALFARAGAASAVAAGTLALTAAAWIAAVHRMRGMDMGVGTGLGSLRFFLVVWLAMMAAMMLPGALPALVRCAHAGPATAAPRFALSYLAVWSGFGLVAYAAYRPHGTTTAALVTLAAALYELTPFKQACRRRCRQDVRSGSQFGLACIGSSIGLMLVLFAVGAMSVTWMVVVTVIVVAQKLLPPNPLLDVPVALSLAGVGIAIALAPASIPGVT